MTVKSKYKFGDTVYVINDPEQKDFILVGMVVRPGSISYELSYLGDSIELYDFEVSDTKDVLKALLRTDKEEE